MQDSSSTNSSTSQKKPSMTQNKPTENLAVPVVAAILMSGEIFRKGLKENEAAAVAKRLVGVAQIIVDEANKS